MTRRMSTTSLIANGLVWVRGGGLSPLATMQAIAGYLVSWPLQETSGAVSLADNIAVPLGRNILVDGDMEAVGTAAWTAAAATLSKALGTRTGGSGTQVLRITRTGAAGRAEQSILETGKPYTLAGWARGDGTNSPQIRNSGALVLWSGTTSTDWQEFGPISFTAIDPDLEFRTVSTNTNYVDFDDVIIQQTDILASSAFDPATDNPLTGDDTGTTPGRAGNGSIQYMKLYDGITSYTDILSAELNSMFDPTKGTLLIATNPAALGGNKDLIRLDLVGSNLIDMVTTSATVILVRQIIGGVQKIISLSAAVGELALYTATWDNTTLRGYKNSTAGTPVAATGLAGNLEAAVIGASSTVPANVYNGDSAYVGLYNEALTQPEIEAIAESMGLS